MFDVVYGVDFSGARLAGRSMWLARIEPSVEPAEPGAVPYRLTQLAALETLCGTAERATAIAHLVRLVEGSERALWALQFPFGLPVEVMEPEAAWPDQMEFVYHFGDDDYGMGLECLRRAKELGGPNHIRRLTDVEEKAPHDPYHYRIIYQTFYGMRDVLGPLRGRDDTAILPFHYDRLPHARRVVVEACPASTLKRLGLPHWNYKQPGGQSPDAKRRRTRREILAGLAAHVAIGRVRRAALLRDGGGDALDAVISAVGAALSWRASDHERVAGHPRYVREGRHYA